ncbi:MAG: CRISPR-associated endoribonuclease Cas6 [Bacteroidales bacterium]
MRIYIKLRSNGTIVPFNHQPQLVGAIHKWIGQNNKEHGRISFFSFSQIKGGKRQGDGLKFTNPFFYISVWDPETAETIIKGICQSPEVCYGLTVRDIQLISCPDMSHEGLFCCDSPILIKSKSENKKYPEFLKYDNPKCGIILKDQILKKMEYAGMEPDQDLEIKFLSTEKAKTRLIDYRGIKNVANDCTVYMKGKPDTLRFIWETGLGSSTGIGFGAISKL